MDLQKPFNNELLINISGELNHNWSDKFWKEPEQKIYTISIVGQNEDKDFYPYLDHFFTYSPEEKNRYFNFLGIDSKKFKKVAYENKGHTTDFLLHWHTKEQTMIVVNWLTEELTKLGYSVEFEE